MASEESSTVILALTDVHNVAEKIGEEFQRLSKQIGAGLLHSIVPIVFGSLVHLERYVEENQRLEIANRKLMLQVDSLAREREERMRLSVQNDDLQIKLETEIEDKKRLSMRIERLAMKREDLAKQLERLKGTALKPVPPGQDPLASTDNQETVHLRGSNDECSSLDFLPNGCDPNDTDRMQFPRMSKRLSLVQVELDKTREKLVEARHNLTSVSAENRSLKAQLNTSKAVAALSDLEMSRSGRGSHDSSCEEDDDTPKFYKKDLLAVLLERNELKEQLDSVRDELSLAKDEIKQLQAQSPRRSTLPDYWPSRPRATTSVREILESLTESMAIITEPETS